MVEEDGQPREEECRGLKKKADVFNNFYLPVRAALLPTFPISKFSRNKQTRGKTHCTAAALQREIPPTFAGRRLRVTKQDIERRQRSKISEIVVHCGESTCHWTSRVGRPRRIKARQLHVWPESQTMAMGRPPAISEAGHMLITPTWD